MKLLKRIWNYFFPRREKGFKWTGNVTPQDERDVEYHEIGFFEPEDFKEKFNKSKSLKEYLSKIDKNE